MAQGLLQAEVCGGKRGIFFDAEKAVLVGSYSDEMSAYRARRSWQKVLDGYFLLDGERDYELLIESSLDSDTFVLSCSFGSACGRYAFWRLLNQQASEAEKQLFGAMPIYRPSTKKLLESALKSEDANQLPWVLSGLGDKSTNGKRGTLFRGLMRLFR